MKKILLFFGVVALLLFSGCSSESKVTSEINGTFDVNITNEDIITQNMWEKCSSNQYGDDCFVVYKFGENDNIGTTLEAVSDAGVYPTPTTLTSLEILSNSAQDSATGTGARKIKVTGLSTNWEEVTEEVTLDGTNAVQLNNQFYRIYRLFVSESGTYATESQSSHQGEITIRESGGGTTWATISDIPIPLGQSEIGIYTIPKGYRGYIGNIVVGVDGNKNADIFLLRRNDAQDTTAPYSARRVLLQFKQVSGIETIESKVNIDSLFETSDIGFMAKTNSGTTAVSVSYEILLVRSD